MSDEPRRDENGLYVYDIDLPQDTYDYLSRAAKSVGITVDEFVSIVIRELADNLRNGPEAIIREEEDIHELIEGDSE